MKEGESVGEREGESGAGKFSKVELGNRCDGGGRGPAGMGGGRVLCVRARVCLMRVHVTRICVRELVQGGGGQGGTGHERTLRERLFYSA